MDRRAWISRLKKQVEKHGADKASWFVSFRDPDGKLRTKGCGPGKIGKASATRLADKIHCQLTEGTYATNERATRDQFVERYTGHIEGRCDANSRAAAMLSIETFARIAKPKLMKSVDTASIDAYIGKRLKENSTRKTHDGKTKTISPATVNRELRYVKAALRLAADWASSRKSR